MMMMCVEDANGIDSFFNVCFFLLFFDDLKTGLVQESKSQMPPTVSTAAATATTTEQWIEFDGQKRVDA